MSGYVDFSRFYDALMEDVDYSRRASYVLKLFEMFSSKPKLLLDVGCGTGSFINEFMKSGIDCIGVDPSEEMLLMAREKCPKALFLNQSAEELDLYGTVDGAVSLMDSLNHITNPDAFSNSLSKVSLFLEPGALFIFDVNTKYKHKCILADNSYVFEDENALCIWRNCTDSDLVTEISLDFFVEKEDGSYERFCDDFSERAYSDEYIKNELKKAKLELVEIYDDLSFDKPKNDSQRVFYIARKV